MFRQLVDNGGIEVEPEPLDAYIEWRLVRS